MLNEPKAFGFEMARIAEVYLSTLSSIMEPHGISKCFVALDYLCANSGQVTQQDLARALRIDKVSAMRMVDYLCDRDFVIRKKDSNDRRCHRLEVTDRALTIHPEIVAAVQKTNDLLFAEFAAEDRVRFEAGMDALFEKIKTLPEPNFIVREFNIKKSKKS